jgi:hypothetical protein
MQDKHASFEQRKMAECLLGQAHLCEQIASACSDEDTAEKFKRRAQACKEAAAEIIVGRNPVAKWDEATVF